MKNLDTIGKYLFVIPIAIFGLFHFMNANAMAGMLPSWLPGGVFWVYLSGLGLILAVVSFFTNKMTKLAMMLLGVELIIFVLILHLPSLLAGNEMAMSGVLKDTALAGCAFMLSAQAKS